MQVTQNSVVLEGFSETTEDIHTNQKAQEEVVIEEDKIASPQSVHEEEDKESSIVSVVP